MVLCLAMHPTAYVLAVGRHDGTTDLVDISNGSVICAMAGDGTPAVSALFDPTGGRLYVGHYSGALRVFDYPSGKLVHELTVADAIKVLCSMGRSTRLALGIADGSLMVLDTVSYRLVGRRDDLFLVNGLAWLTGSDELVSVSRDLFVRRWSADLDLLGEVTAHSRSIKVICASPDGRHWATAGYDAEVMIWSHNGLVARCKGHDLPGVAALSWLDSRTLVSGGWDCTLKVWDIAGECHGTVSLDERKEGLRHDIVHIAVDEPAGRFAEPRTAGVLR
ncbi:MAG: hypothetical protein HC869_03465 [Rhodospirillales bacterium]|nr:hypothetical protein [Rhodospirillales bacterium]